MWDLLSARRSPDKVVGSKIRRIKDRSDELRWRSSFGLNRHVTLPPGSSDGIHHSPVLASSAHTLDTGWSSVMESDPCHCLRLRTSTKPQPSSDKHIQEHGVSSVWCPPARSAGKSTRASSALSVIVLVIVVLMASTNITLAASLGGDGRTCDYQGCWEVFQRANNDLLVPDRYTASYQPTAHDLEARCIALRTFHVCIGNLTDQPGCLGNLNFHSSQKGIETQMKQNNCSEAGPVFNPGDHPRPTGPDSRPCSYAMESDTYVHCGLFGDPHLRTWGGTYQTCRVQGAWPLIDNQYFAVQVTNELVSLKPRATATTRITVVVKQNDECFNEQFVTYQAQSNSLPGIFDDGRTELGSYESVTLSELEPNKHIEIHIRYIDTVLVIRQVGRYLTFSARMPESFVNNTHTSAPVRMQLCNTGCPSAELIDYKSYIAQQKKRTRLKNAAAESDGDRSEVADDRSGSALVVPPHGLTRDEAADKCRKVGAVDFYFESCVFDLLTTSDNNFTIAAYYALHDVRRLTPQAQPLTNGTSFVEIDNLYANSSPSMHSTEQLRKWRTLLIACMCLLMNLFIYNGRT